MTILTLVNFSTNFLGLSPKLGDTKHCIYFRNFEEQHSKTPRFSIKTDIVVNELNKNSNNCNSDDSIFISDVETDSFIDCVNEVNNLCVTIESLCSEIHTPKGLLGVHNLSDMALTESQKTLLDKGLKFCPTPSKPDIGDILRDIDNFFRSANLKIFFMNDDKNSKKVYDPLQPFQHQDLKVRSTWNPPVPPLLEHVKQLIINDLQNTKLEPCRQKNLTREQFLAINALKNNNDVVIKAADKGSGIVIMNRDDYIREGERQLGDINFYKCVDSDLTNIHCEQVRKVVDSMFHNNEISSETYRYLLTDNNRTAEFYMLPKIHKSLVNPPGRPIISGNDCPTEKISHMLDTILQPFVPSIKSFVRDTTDFIQKLNSVDLSGHDSIILCTLDVSSLYTNIPQKEGLNVIKQLLASERPSAFLPKNNNLCKLLELVLTKNNFRFNNKHFLQINGTAMGTRVAPTYANLYMSHFEDLFVYTYPKQPLLWLRYIDDIFMIWTHGEAELKKFIDHLNSARETIKFTCDWSTIQVSFLDTVVKINSDNALYTDLYCKPTDTHSYLRFNSCHPKHVTKGLPYSQFLRLRRICSNYTDFFIHSLRMVRDFVDRDYPAELVLGSLLKVADLDRDELLTSSPDSKSNDTDGINLYLIVNYNPANPPIQDIVLKHWPTLGRSSATRPLVNAKIIFGHRRPPNLKDNLIRSRLPPGPDDITPDWPTCKSGARCRHCPRLNKSGKITSHSTGRSFTSTFNACCQSKNLIYCISCNLCGIQYVGQTITPLMTRINNHLSTIRTKKDLPLPNHMQTHGTSDNPSLTVHVLEFIRAPVDSFKAKQARDQKERDWMARLHTLVPHGLNLQE